MTTAALLVTGVGAAACVSDIRRGRVPNPLTLGAAAAAAGFHVAEAGSAGLIAGALGWAIGLLLLLPLFAARGIGAGDVKLLAAFGAWLGPVQVLFAAFVAVLAGGALALGILLVTGGAHRVARNARRLMRHWAVAGPAPLPGLTIDDAPGPRLPFAVPLTVGVLVTVWL